MKNIVILDAYTTNPGDLSWDRLKKLGNLTIYERTASEQIIKRAADAEILLLNKVHITRAVLAALPKLVYIGVLATGYDNVDLEGAREKGIPVCNAFGYSTDAVAQHVFALILALLNKVYEHNEKVQAGEWQTSMDFSFTIRPIIDLKGKTMGILGLGTIGKQVAKIAQAFGMKVLATKRNPQKGGLDGVVVVNERELFEKSDFLTLHAPLNQETKGIINRTTLALMKPSAFLINTGRGGLIVEEDLKNALLEKNIAGAALDVLTQEPPRDGNVLIGLDNCMITPHVAWASVDSRMKLIEETALNIEAFLRGEERNRVN